MILLASWLLLAAGLALPPYQPDGEVDGIRVERRSIPDSDFNEYRITTSSSASLERLCDAIFARQVDLKLERRFKKRQVLKETPTERWTYEQISVPVVADRDYVMHVSLRRPASSGVCAIHFQTEDDFAHPPVDGVVRIGAVWGDWTLVAHASGAVEVTYEIFSDPGGSVPAFLARGRQRDEAIGFMKTILARANDAAPDGS